MNPRASVANCSSVLQSNNPQARIFPFQIIEERGVLLEGGLLADIWAAPHPAKNHLREERVGEWKVF